MVPQVPISEAQTLAMGTPDAVVISFCAPNMRIPTPYFTYRYNIHNESNNTCNPHDG